MSDFRSHCGMSKTCFTNAELMFAMKASAYGSIASAPTSPAISVSREPVICVKSLGWQWHLDQVFAKINGVQHYLWRAVDHEGEVYRNSPPCIHQHTIISTINAISRPEPDLNNYETPPYSNGASSLPPKTCCLADFGDWFALD